MLLIAMLFADTNRFLLSDSPRCDSMLVLWNMDFISHVTVCALQVRLLILTGFCGVRDHCVTICCALGYGLYIYPMFESPCFAVLPAEFCRMLIRL